MKPALTKTLANRVRKLLNYVDFRMAMTRDMPGFQDWKRQVSDELCECRAALNAWWGNEKKRRRK